MSQRVFLRVALLCALVISVPFLASAQDAAILTGKVTDPEGEPLAGANVFIELTNLGAATDAAGKYAFTVPAKAVRGQEVKLTARFIGYHTKTEKITLRPGTIEVNFSLAEDVLDMDAIVVTGVLGEMPKEKLAFTVARVETEALEMVPAVNAVSGLKGKVAGAKIIQGQGQPGTGVSVKLRGATTVTGSNSPLFIVDGVILGANQVDIDALDIESIEVVKGAAAASLYGSRAANGVINIKTKRGSALGQNQTRLVIRNELGRNELAKKVKVSKHHEFKVNEQGQFIDDEGNVVPFGEAVLDDDRFGGGVAFQDNEFPGKLFDHMDLFFDPGTFYRNYASVTHSSSTTNYRLSFGNLKDPGAVIGQEGYWRRNLRVNLDHRIAPGLDLSLTGYYASSKRDDAETDFAPNPFFGLMFMNPNVDLTEPNEDGTPFKIQPDPRTLEENPLYAVHFAEIDFRRQRTQGSLNLRYAPVNWFDIEGNFSFDRSDRNNQQYYPKGFKTIDATFLNQGIMVKENEFDQAINASLTATLAKTFGDLTTRTQVRYLVEQDKFDNTYAEGRDLTVADVRDLGVVRGEEIINSAFQEVNAVGWFFITALDYRDKYIADFLIRRDGSSLFGPQDRWHTYFRASGAWRLSLEPFWFTDKINEFKIRYSYGTAGGRPTFSAQYETFSVSQGIVSKATLGNKKLKPEFAVEQEVGLNMVLFDRIGLELTYARTETEDILLQVPLAGYYGFSTQWQNAGTLLSKTFEASLQSSLIRKRDVSWSATINFDATSQKITKFGRAPYRYGPLNAFYNREGETFGAIYGRKWIDSMDLLSQHLGGVHANSLDQFDINDDGFVVAVGSGNTYKDGFSKNLWGTTVTVDGITYDWGLPIGFLTPEGGDFTKLGDVVPDFNLSFGNTFRWKGFTAYVLLDAEVGGQIYNNTKQWGFRELRGGEVDQFGKPEELKKPITYYAKLYDVNNVNSFFLEDGTYLKLRELNVSYTFDRGRLQNLFGGFFGQFLNRLTIGVIGRNLLTFTGYDGFDPEVGRGDATLFRVDNFGYPNYRTYTGFIEFEL